MLNNNPNNQHQVNNSSLMATLIHDTDRMSSLEIANSQENSTHILCVIFVLF
nr:MAG TPA: hypothetical protein [Caudoviricetes sp.]